MNNEFKKNDFVPYTIAVLTIIIWSLTFIVAKFLVNFSPIEISFYRWIISFIILTPFFAKKLLKNIKYLKGKWIYIIIISILGISAHNTFIYLSAHTSNAINMSLLGSLSPVIIALFNKIIWKINLNKNQKLGLLIAIIGTFILITKGNFKILMNFTFAIGDLYMIISVFSFAVYSSSLRIRPNEINQGTFFYLTVFIGIIPLIIAMIFKYYNNDITELNVKSSLSLIYLGVFSATLGFLLWSVAISKIGALKCGIIGNLVPLFTSVEASILLNEKIFISQIVGGIFIIIGVLFSTISYNYKNK